MGLWLISMPLTANVFLLFWEEPLSSPELVEPNSYDAIVILGGMVEGLSPEGQWLLGGSVDRLTEAFRLYKREVAPLVLITGGNSGVLSEHLWTEADVMEDFLATMGVPLEKIIREDQAQNTYQNALYSWPLLAEAGASKILLVTSAYHMKRSLAIFQKMGFEVSPFSVDSRKLATEFPLNLLPSLSAFGAVSIVMREMVGTLVYKLIGYL